MRLRRWLRYSTRSSSTITSLLTALPDQTSAAGRTSRYPQQARSNLSGRRQYADQGSEFRASGTSGLDAWQHTVTLPSVQTDLTNDSADRRRKKHRRFGVRNVETQGTCLPAEAVRYRLHPGGDFTDRPGLRCDCRCPRPERQRWRRKTPRRRKLMMLATTTRQPVRLGAADADRRIGPRNQKRARKAACTGDTPSLGSQYRSQLDRGFAACWSVQRCASR